MRKIAEIKSDKRLRIVESGFDGMACYLHDKRYKAPREMAIIASWAGGWEHVSVSLRNRCPTWDEMCLVKDIFWRDDRRKTSMLTFIRIVCTCGRKSAKKQICRRKSLFDLEGK